MSGKYKTKELIFAPGCYIRVYQSQKRNWCWLVRLTEVSGKTYISKGSNFSTRISAEKDMLLFIGGIEPILNQYHCKISPAWGYKYYNHAISKSMSYMHPVIGIFAFFLSIKFLWCKLFHRKHHFYFHESLETPICVNNIYYYNKYCSKCWCARETIR